MVILGVDPGTASTGWGVVEKSKGDIHLLKYGCVKTPVDMVMPKRLLMLRDEMGKIMRGFKPDSVVVERIFFNTNAKTAIGVGQARGVIMLLSAEYEIDFFEYTALQAKKVLTGYGRATKKDMQKATKDYLGLKEKIKPDDAADALAMAIFHGRLLSESTD